MKEIDPYLPINKVAALVVSKHFEAQASVQKSDYVTSMIKLPTHKFSGPPNEDLTGVSFGRIKVIGFSLWKPSRKDAKGRWVVKCMCGRFFVLTSKAINRKSVSTCMECHHTNYLNRLSKIEGQ
jgi:hypothetical protein